MLNCPPCEKTNSTLAQCNNNHAERGGGKISKRQKKVEKITLKRNAQLIKK